MNNFLSTDKRWYLWLCTCFPCDSHDFCSTQFRVYSIWKNKLK